MNLFLFLGRGQCSISIDGQTRSTLYRAHRVHVGNDHGQQGGASGVVLSSGGDDRLSKVEISGKLHFETN